MTSEEFRHIAEEHRSLARQEALPNVRAVLAASAEKWEFLADIAARDDQRGLRTTDKPRRARPELIQLQGKV